MALAKVKIYSTSTCPFCKMLREYLNSKQIKFEDVLLDQHPDEVQTSIDTCNSMGVPCVHITTDDGREVNILGFDRPKIDLALGLA